MKTDFIDSPDKLRLEAVRLALKYSINVSGILEAADKWDGFFKTTGEKIDHCRRTHNANALEGLENAIIHQQEIDNADLRKRLEEAEKRAEQLEQNLMPAGEEKSVGHDEHETPYGYG
jgi:hypothetical protein